jgi:hypothetical protein
MSWNIDVVLIANAGSSPPSELLPDVLAPREAMIGFEDATSVMRFDPPELCVSALGGWGVVIDAPCKLRGLGSHLQAQSIGREVRVVHVGMSPTLLAYRNGAEALALTGIGACRAELLKRPHQCSDLSDGELVAWALIDQTVGTNFLDAMWKAKFSVFGAA